MTDELLAAPDTDEASDDRSSEENDLPAAKAPVIEAKSDVDERVKGFQRLLAKEQQEKKDLARRLADLEETQRLAGMSEDERAQYTSRREREELEELRAWKALQDLADEYPDELPVFQRLLKAGKGGTARDQLEALREWRNPKKAAPEPSEDDTPDVDPNNPPRNPPDEDAITLEDGSRMTMRRAMSLLKRR